jgi:hypothetical protein
LTDAELMTGSLRTDIGHLAGTRDAQGRAGPAATRRTIEYVLRAAGDNPRVLITARSEKGGVARREVRLGGGG